MIRKKSPKPTRYMRTLRLPPFFRAGARLVLVAFFAVRLLVDFVFRVVISQPRVQHVEVYLETFVVIAFEQAVAQIEVALTFLAAFAVWTIKFSSNQVTDTSWPVVTVFEWRLGY